MSHSASIITKSLSGSAATLILFTAAAQAQNYGPLPAPQAPSKFMNLPSYGFSGIGVIGSNVDLLSNPAAGRFFPARMPTYSFGVPCYRPPVCPHPYYAPQQPVYAGGYSGTGAYVSSGSGLTVNGAYSSGNWKVGFHVGSNPYQYVANTCGPTYVPPVCSYPLWGWTTRYGYYWGDYYPYSYYNYATGPSTYGNDPRLYTNFANQNLNPAPNQQQAQPSEPPTALEVGKAMIAADQPKHAIEAFRRDIKEHGSEGTTMRYLAIALAEDKQIEEAAAVMRSAYRIDPALATSPIDLVGLGYSERTFRELIARCVVAANRLNTGSSWLLVTSLMQAEGRTEPARRMLEKASKQGLEPAILDPLQSALK